MLTAELVLVVVTQKVAIPLGGRESQISLAFLIHFGMIVFLAMRGVLLVSAWRLFLFCTFAGLAALGQMQFVTKDWSFPSMVLMLATSAFFVFVVPLGRSGYIRLLRRFVLVAGVAAVLVGVDWAVQLVKLPMPDLEALIPRPLVYYEYNYIQPVAWDSPWMKPNGVFFLETSHVSQFIGIGLVLELALFRRGLVMLLLGGALVSTLGVTGMLLVGTSIPFLLARAKPGVLLAVLIVLPLGAGAAHKAGILDGMLRRTAEFSQGSSSGYNRFVLPVEWLIQTLEAPTETALFGTGAGSMPKTVNDDEAGIAGFTWPPYTKIVVEYGTLALAVWLFFIGASLFGHGIPAVVSWAAFAQYNFLNGSLNVPIHTVYCVLLCTGYALKDSDVFRRS